MGDFGIYCLFTIANTPETCGWNYHAKNQIPRWLVSKWLLAIFQHSQLHSTCKLWSSCTNERMHTWPTTGESAYGKPGCQRNMIHKWLVFHTMWCPYSICCLHTPFQPLRCSISQWNVGHKATFRKIPLNHHQTLVIHCYPTSHPKNVPTSSTYHRLTVWFTTKLLPEIAYLPILYSN